MAQDMRPDPFSSQCQAARVAAAAVCSAIIRWTASALSVALPRPGKIRSGGCPSCSRSQVPSTATVLAVSGVHLSLRPFPRGADVGAGAELDVAAAQLGELRDTQPGLEGQHEQSVISTPGARVRTVGRGEEGFDLRLGQERNDAFPGPFVGDGEDTLDEPGVLWVAQRGEPEERVQRGEPSVAGADAVGPVVFEVGQERCDHLRVEVLEL